MQTIIEQISKRHHDQRFDRTWLCAGLLLTGLLCQATDCSADDADRLKYFETHIRPLLHTKCVKCHGENKQEGGLRLDSAEGLQAGGESGPSVTAGQPGESLLMEAVRYESLEMPPDKPLGADEISHLEKWIADGMAWPQQDGQSVRLQGAAFTEEERNFWSLQPIRHPDPPDAGENWALNEIDRFIAARHTNANLTPAPRAPNQVLLRRLYLDVLGVPPNASDVPEYSASATASEWSKLVDKLLDDARYGEHWARYWLDVVRYAESDGFRADFYRPDAWRYRDYVVNAFNDDKPYNQFVTEQLAGDEVAPDRAEALVATGYLRTYLYEYNQRDARTQWQDILNQVTDVTGEVFLGMGVGCARCHDHKFDPILQQDYFRLQAGFATMIPRDDVPAADRAERDRYQQEYDAWQSRAAELRKQLHELRDPYMQRAAKGAIKRFPEDIQAIMARPPEDRTPLEAQLADLVNRQVIYDQDRQKISEAHQKEIDELEQQLAELAGKKPPALPTALTVADVGAIPQPVHLGANPKRKTVSAGGFTILAPDEFALQPHAGSTGQRTALAQWITDPDNPLTARVIVNRIWQRHFGTGLVATASDFGSLGGKPSHPELLDWLASEFIAHGWSIKWLHRQILTSATWQMSAFHPNPESPMASDPGNRLRWRFDIRRLNAEQIRDTMLAASGELQSEQGGPSVGHDSLRRSVYLKAMRNNPEPLMNSLDGVDGLNSVPRRSTTTTPTQALNLMNGTWVRARSKALAARILDQFDGQKSEELIDGLFLTALSRHADENETAQCLQFLADAGGLDGNNPEASTSEPVLSASTGPAIRFGEDASPPLKTADSAPAIAAPFTFVGMFQLDALYKDASVRTLISQWNSGTKTPGWSIGVTSEKSRYQPRNFILQVVGEEGYEVVASDLRPQLGKAYLAAVTVQRRQESSGGKATATFYLQEIDTAAKEQLRRHELSVAAVDFKSSEKITGDFPIVVGGRSESKGAKPNHRWNGLLDQALLYDRALDRKDIQNLFDAQLMPAQVLNSRPIAFWDFGQTDTGDPAKNFPLSAADERQSDPELKALTELCHVLLNSNEFVYVD